MYHISITSTDKPLNQPFWRKEFKHCSQPITISCTFLKILIHIQTDFKIKKTQIKAINILKVSCLFAHSNKNNYQTLLWSWKFVIIREKRLTCFQNYLNWCFCICFKEFFFSVFLWSEGGATFEKPSTNKPASESNVLIFHKR